MLQQWSSFPDMSNVVLCMVLSLLHMNKVWKNRVPCRALNLLPGRYLGQKQSVTRRKIKSHNSNGKGVVCPAADYA